MVYFPIYSLRCEPLEAMLQRLSIVNNRANSAHEAIPSSSTKAYSVLRNYHQMHIPFSALKSQSGAIAGEGGRGKSQRSTLGNERDEGKRVFGNQHTPRVMVAFRGKTRVQTSGDWMVDVGGCRGNRELSTPLTLQLCTSCTSSARLLCRCNASVLRWTEHTGERIDDDETDEMASRLRQPRGRHPAWQRAASNSSGNQ